MPRSPKRLTVYFLGGEGLEDDAAACIRSVDCRLRAGRCLSCCAELGFLSREAAMVGRAEMGAGRGPSCGRQSD